MLKHLRYLALSLLFASHAASATWPTVDVDTTDLDSATDSPAAARVDLYDLAVKFNQARGHVSVYAQSLLDDADAAAARTTLGAAGTGVANTFTAAQTISITGTGDALTLESTDSGVSSAPNLSLYRNSSSPAANDILTVVSFDGEDSAGNKQQYAAIYASIVDPTSTSEDGKLILRTINAGAAQNIEIDSTGRIDNLIAVPFKFGTGANGYYGRLIASATTIMSVNFNSPAAQDNAAYPSWNLVLDPPSDQARITRVPAGSTTPATMFNVDGTGRVDITGTLASSKACASGYTRVGPNYCAADTPTEQSVALFSNSTWYTITLSGVPSSAKAVNIVFYQAGRPNGTGANRNIAVRRVGSSEVADWNNIVLSLPDTADTNPLTRIQRSTMTVPVNSSGQIQMHTNLGTGVITTCYVAVMGYHD